ncbi:MAG: hypothetical protein F6K61_21530 [Sphaerospermopsis sp. SIO1G1]|nr:hypothetical protein [Sphaerospermopsis sp. SIO1G1]
MLARGSNSTNASPFHFKKDCVESASDQVENLPVENNRERTFRRAANACEVASGVCLNSTIIFTFHLLQVHPVGIFLAVGTCHFYFTATAVGEKSLPVAIVGGACSLSVLCSTSEPLGEWWEARQSVQMAAQEIDKLYPQKHDFDFPISGVLVTFIFLIGKFALSNLKFKK